eukprot:snap_masked-scaffold_103-processed-gene-0.16-mRNA-1 protein AED:1.00 eAED:1.00 QI:0/-1/0/0/-1/1/1/0/61
MDMGNAADFFKKIKFYGGHYHQLNGLCPKARKKNSKVAVASIGTFKKEKFEFENVFEVAPE